MTSGGRKIAPGFAALAAALLLSACAAPASRSGPVEPPRERGFPGFDISIYPGDAAMRAWRRPGSPYHWVGYYLPAPCRRDTSWTGRRAQLADMGWGFAVLYVGQQTWDNVRDVEAPADTTREQNPAAAAQRDTMVVGDSARAAEVTCSRTLLSATRGATDADDAIARAASEGFPRGTTIFLNIERMEQVSQAMRDYYRAWVGRVLSDGRFRPGVYAHHRNAAEIHGDVAQSFAAAGTTARPAFWVANPSAFALVAAPGESGHPFATIWQGALDVPRSWNGITLTIDENVADVPSPSAPPAMFPGGADTEGECGTVSCTTVASTGTTHR
jgi:hypothetical protein